MVIVIPTLDFSSTEATRIVIILGLWLVHGKLSASDYSGAAMLERLKTRRLE